MTYADGVNNLRALVGEHVDGNLVDIGFSEADTRAKLIDRLLTTVLGWPEELIIREEHSESGYADYVLRCPARVLVVEAKRVGHHFSFPVEKQRRTYALSSLRSEANGVGAAVNQARAYADDNGIEYACVTNGIQWIVFRAITPGEPWASGIGIVYRSLAEIEANFTDFWNLLSYDAVSQYSLRREFTSSIRERHPFERPLDKVLYSDVPLQRNTLSAQLQPLIAVLFRDLTGAEQEEVLRRCYVVDRKVQGVSKEVQEIFNDSLPRFAQRAGFQDLVESEERSGALTVDFQRAVTRGDFGSTILLLGGVGSGKTTFIHRFFRITAREFVDKHCLWFYVPFTDAPLNSIEFGDFLRRRIMATLDERHPALDITSPAVLRAIYAEPLAKLSNGLWSTLSPKRRAKKEVSYLEQRMAEVGHCDRVLRHLRQGGRAVTIVLDNVDQRAPSEQVEVFLLAHELCRAFDAIIIVALREESFFRAEQAGAFNAYHNIRYHIASPDVRSLLRKRVEYALEISSAGTEALRIQLRSGIEFKAEEILNFMGILRDGALKHNPAISQFIDAISQGNMRSALDMFNQFMVSGSTDVEKMLQFFRRHGQYHVAEHEFIKAVMLGDFQFYKERRSRVMNLFEVSSAAAASNLTAPRILEYLSHRSGHAHAEGVGFLEIQQLLSAFSELFGESEDALFHIGRLVDARLVESENRQIGNISSARFVRLTKSGLYYISALIRRFQYLDVVCLDTPIWDRRILSELSSRAATSEMIERVYRVEWMLGYLKREEERSTVTVSEDMLRLAFGGSIVARIEQGLRADLLRMARGAQLTPASLERVRTDVAACMK